MNKIDYITRQFSRAEKKRFEHCVVTRIWHLLNDLSIKFVTQQYVVRPDKRALTDMFFPQLHIHIEIDEKHHETQKQIEWDKLREVDIVNATGHEILKVDVTKDIDTINNEIAEIVEYIKSKKSTTQNFKPWDIEAEFNPQTYIDKGFIDLNDDCAFRTIVDAVNCFGNNFKGYQKAGAKHPYKRDTIIWLPKLYPNEEWNNSISDNEEIIIEKPNNHSNIKEHVDKHINSYVKYRIVFAKVKSPLGDIMYRFKGEYELDRSLTNYTDGLFWRRVSERVKTYNP